MSTLYPVTLVLGSMTLALGCRGREQAHSRVPIAAAPPAAAPAASPVGASPPQPPSLQDSVGLLFVGVYDPGQVRVTTGEVAYGLFRTGQTWELASVRLTVDSTLYPCRADERAAEAHPRLAIDHPGTPILLLRGVAGLVSGPVLTLVPGDLKPYPGQTLGPYIIGHALWELIGSGASEYRPTRLRPSDANRPAVLGYRLALWSRERDTSQVVYGPYSIFWPPAVAWVGDLDRDGLVDLVLTPSVGQEEPVAPELWLSSLATAGELVHWVTGRRTIYCD